MLASRLLLLAAAVLWSTAGAAIKLSSLTGWQISGGRSLVAGLKAVPAGLVELRWGIICPSCLTSSQQTRALDEIKPEGHCQLCDISFDLELIHRYGAVVRAVELGQVQITATADADLGEGTRELVTLMDVTIVAGEAVAGVIQPLGEATPIPKDDQ